MNVKRYQQLFLFLVALVLPSLVIAALGWMLLAREREIEDGRSRAARAVEISEVRQTVLDRLEGISSATQSTVAAPSSPIVLATQLDEADGLLLPWQDETSRVQFSLSELAPGLARQLAEARRAEDEKNYERAAEIYIQALRDAGDDSQWAYVQLAVARTLILSGASAKGRAAYVGLLSLSSDVVDDYGDPYTTVFAAPTLLKLRGADEQILARAARDLDDPARLNADVADQWRKVVEKLRDSADAGIRENASALVEKLHARKKYMEAASTLQAGFSKLGVTTTAWRHYDDGEDPWLIRMTERPESKPLVVVVRAMDIFESVKADRAEAGVSPVQFAFDGSSGCEPLSERLLPDLCVNFSASGPTAAGGSGLLRLFFGLSLLVVMSLTFLAGYLVWRDTRREIRVSEMRSQFVSSVSHELKTPLTSIRMFAELLQIRGSDDSRTHEEYLNTIVNESERLTRLLNNVLDFSKIEHGQKDYRLEPTRLEEVVYSAARIMEYPLAEQGFDLRVHVETGLPPVNADKDALKQAVLNLLTNAMKYSGKSRAIEVRVGPQNGNAMIQVADHGLGIPESEQKRIFEKFYRANVPENHAISGTGLGLALVAHIAGAHHGSVRVESKVGEGSTFSILLPLRAGGTS